MKEVLRLIRISLLLRLIPSFVGLVGLVVSNNFRLIGVGLSFTLPSLLVLMWTWLAQRRGAISPQRIRQFLFFTVIAYIIETILPGLFFRMVVAQQWLPAELAPDVGNNSNAAIPQLFILIPAVLGAWVDGKRDGLKWAFLAIVPIGLGLAVTFWFQSISGRDVGGFIAQALVTLVVCYFVGSLADRQREEQTQLEHANKQLEAQAFVREQLAASRERMSLSRDLHDTVAHSLAALAVQINAIDAVLLNDAQAAKREISTARNLIKESLNNTRRAVAGLRVNWVEDFGLSGALQKQVDLFNQRATTQAHYERNGDEPVLSDLQADTLFRIAQEALNNVEKHSKAAHVQVRLACCTGVNNALTLSIQDDGVGFNVDDVDHDRFGIRGMRERAELAGAHLRLDSATGKGTSITIRL